VNDWPEVTLADVCDKPQYGAIAKGSKLPVGPRFVRQTDITTGRIDWDTVPHCDLELADFEKYAITTGDLLISRLGAGVGTAATVDDGNGAVFAGYLVRFQPNTTIADPQFVGYQLRSRAWWNHVHGFRSGAAQPTLNAKQMGAFKFPLPSLEEQRRIAEALSSLDDKIGSNRRAIALTEELGASLLDDRLELDVYGFPEYDEQRCLGDFLDVLETGSRPKGGASQSGAVSLGAESVFSAGVDTTSRFKYVPTDFAAGMRRGRLQDGDILVYKDGGKPGNFTPHVSAFGYGFPVDEAVINEHVYRVRAKSPIGQGLLYWLLRSSWMDQEMRKRGTGVAIPGLNSSNFRSLPIPGRLDPEALDQLNERLSPMLTSMLCAGVENRRLAALRDVLLPELLTGRLRVSHAAEALA
jgi:type I restriction enzyme S subunit